LQSNIKQPQVETRKFNTVLVGDLKPGQHSKWQQGTVTAVLERPRYDFKADGQCTQEVHVDYLHPAGRNEVQADMVSNPIEGPEGELAIPCTRDWPIMPA